MPVIKADFKDFTQTLTRCGIIDGDYPVKGCFVWLPYGFILKEKFFAYIENEIKFEGYARYQFPRLIHGQAIRQVTKGIADFEDGLFWLRKKDGTNFDLFLNPTGECGVYTMFKKWVRHETDLPLRAYQIGNIFRPHNHPNILLNGDELTNLLEAHSAFSSKKESDNEFLRIVEVLKVIHENFCIPCLVLRRPIQGNKPVCTDMVSFETYLNSKNSSFNVGVLYNQGQIYSKAFDVSFSKQRGGKDNTYQVTFGISERGVAAMLDLHRDEFGLRLLPEFSPTQIVIIPVYGKNGKNGLNNYANKIKKLLEKENSVYVDLSNSNSSKKFALARQQGIPIRIGITAKNIASKTVRVYIRTEEEALDEIPLDSLKKIINESFAKIKNSLNQEAKDFLKSKIHPAKDLDNLGKAVNKGLIAKMYWCGSMQCLNELNAKLPGEMLGTQFETDGPVGKCLICGKLSMTPSYYAKRSSSP